MEIKSKEIKIVDITTLKMKKNNRNKHPQDQIDELASHFKYQGFRNPLIVSNLSGEIVCGNGRYLAALRAGLKQLPVIFEDFDSKEQEYEFHVADNGLSLWASLDIAAIKLDLQALPDLDPKMLGLKEFHGEPLPIEGLTDPDEVPTNPEPVCKLGDIWQLGNHRMMCGDSTDLENIKLLLDGINPDMIFTDPPYGININCDYGSHMAGNMGRSKKSYKQIKNDDKNFDPTFIIDFFKEQKIFIWGANYFSEKLPKADWIVWNKKVTEGMKKMFGKDFELCWTNQKAGIMYDVAWAGCFGHDKKLGGDTKTHPSMKSVKLICSMFADYEADTVVDLYLGSGSTLIACEKTNRKCFGMEIDPEYCDIVIARWEKFTGKKAEKVN